MPAEVELCAFASHDAPAWHELPAELWRAPLPRRLRQHLTLPAGKFVDGLHALGIDTVGALLEHLLRDRREARAVAQLRPGEQATVVVEVQSIAARPVRRRGGQSAYWWLLAAE